MKLSDLIQEMARVVGKPPATVALCARLLREAGHIATGGRGPGGAKMNEKDCAALLIGLVASPQIKESADYVSAYKNSFGIISHIDDDLRDIPEFDKRFSAFTVISELIRRANSGWLENFLKLSPSDSWKKGGGIEISFARPIPSAEIIIRSAGSGKKIHFIAHYKLMKSVEKEFMDRIVENNNITEILDFHWTKFPRYAQPDSSFGDLSETAKITHGSIFYLGFNLR